MDPHSGTTTCHLANITYTFQNMYLIFRVTSNTAEYKYQCAAERILLVFWPHSGQNHFCVKILKTGIPLFIALSEDSVLRERSKNSGSLSAVWTIVLSGPDPYLSTVPYVQTTCFTVWTPDRPSIIRPNDVHFCRDPPLCGEVSIRLASIRTSQQPVQTPLSTRPASDFFQVQIWEN